MRTRLRLSHDPSTLCLTNLISLSLGELNFFNPILWRWVSASQCGPTTHTTRNKFQFSSSSPLPSLVPAIVRDGPTINSNYPSVIGAIGSRLGELVEPNITAQFNEECTCGAQAPLPQSHRDARGWPLILSGLAPQCQRLPFVISPSSASVTL